MDLTLNTSKKNVMCYGGLSHMYGDIYVAIHMTMLNLFPVQSEPRMLQNHTTTFLCLPVIRVSQPVLNGV